MKYYLGSEAGEFVFMFGDKTHDVETSDTINPLVIPTTPERIIKTIFRKINIANNIRMRIQS